MKWTIDTDTMEIQVFPNLKALSRAAAEVFTRLANRSAAASENRFTVALSGGSTPKNLFQMLSSEDESFHRSIEWNKVHLFWSDERCVVPYSEESNFKTAFDNLIRPLGISAMNYHRLKGELEPQIAAEEYERVLRLYFNLAERDVPRFDLILLGMGADGHTASLFPGNPALVEKNKLVAAPFVEKFGKYRLTFTPPVINSAANIVFLVAGKDKADALQAILEGAHLPEKYPSQIIKPSNGKLLFLADEAAAKRLSLRHAEATQITNYL